MLTPTTDIFGQMFEAEWSVAGVGVDACVQWTVAVVIAHAVAFR